MPAIKGIEMSLYPIKFKPILLKRVWGGKHLSEFKSLKNKVTGLGESWELSSVQTKLSVVANGFLKGNTIEELTEIYMGDLVGEKVYERFGMEFPLLLKFIDSAEALSIQVHPDDKLALERHNAYGKTELWYIIEADKDSELYVGFNRQLTEVEFAGTMKRKELLSVLNVENPQAGDVFFLPAGRIHAIGKHIMLAEIQQTSDITYRIYDWGREDNPETAREMHLDLAQDALDYSYSPSYKIPYKRQSNTPVRLATCPYFTVNLLDFNRPLERDYAELDSFVAYMCLEGACSIVYDGGSETVARGETVLLPATLVAVELLPQEGCKLLEVYIE